MRGRSSGEVAGSGWRAWRLLAAVAVALLVLAGCAGEGYQAGGAEPALPPESQAPARDGAGTATADQGAGGGATGAAGSAGTVRLADPGARIVRTATVRLGVDEGALAPTIDRATAMVTRLDGTYVASSTTVADGDGAASGRVTFRVPVAAYEQALRELKGLGRYLGEEADSKDVTAEYVDLDAQVTAWRAQERTYLKLLERARTVGDVIAIQKELAQVQQNIERLQGQIDYLADQSARSTIVLDISEPGAAAEPDGVLARAWAFALDGLLTMAAAALVLAVWSVPFLLLGGAVVLVVMRVRRLRRTEAAGPAAPSAPA